MAKLEPVIKVTLGTGKVVLLREPQIKDNEMALQVASSKSKSDTMVGVFAQKELLKMLIVSVDNVKPTAIQKEDLDSMFTYREYMQMQKVLLEVSGGGETGEYRTEVVTSGGK